MRAFGLRLRLIIVRQRLGPLVLPALAGHFKEWFSMKKMSFRMNQLAFGVLALVCLGAAPAFGQTWIGTVSDLWFTAGNWSPGTVPNSGSAVVTISNATNNPVILNSSATISTLTIGSA